MANELVIADNMDYASLAALTGQDAGSNQSGKPKNTLPQLRINYDHVISLHPGEAPVLEAAGVSFDAAKNDKGEDVLEVAVPAGAFKIAVPDGDKYKVIYAKTVKFTPLVLTWSWLRYDPTANEGKGGYVNRTIHIKNDRKDVALDELGGQFCGAIRFRKREELSPAQQDLNRQIKQCRNIFGLVTLTGKTVYGEKVELTAFPCQLTLKNWTGYKQFEATLATINASKKLIFNTELTLTTIRQKNGSVNYYTVNADFDPAVTIPAGEQTVKLFTAFSEHIDAENALVMTAHKRARDGGAANPNSLDDDFGDLAEDFV